MARSIGRSRSTGQKVIAFEVSAYFLNAGESKLLRIRGPFLLDPGRYGDESFVGGVGELGVETNCLVVIGARLHKLPVLLSDGPAKEIEFGVSWCELDGDGEVGNSLILFLLATP